MKSIPDDAWVPIRWRPWQFGLDSLNSFEVLVPPDLATRLADARDKLDHARAVHDAAEDEVNQIIVDRLKGIS